MVTILSYQKCRSVLPVITFTDDSSTGMYSAGACNVDFATSGVKRLKIADDLITSNVPITAPTVSAIVLTSDSMLSWNVTIPFTLLSLFASGAVTASGYYPSNNSGATFFPGAMNNTSQSYGTVTFYAPCAMIVEFTKLIKHNINYKLHNVFTDGILDDDTYMMFFFENPNFYFGRIDIIIIKFIIL